MGSIVENQSSATSTSEFWGEDLLSSSELPALDGVVQRTLAHHRKAIQAASSTLDASVPMVIILNILSLTHADAYHLANVHVFYLNPHQLLYGDHLNQQSRPRIICCLKRRHEAQRYLDHLTSVGDLGRLDSSRPYWQEITSIGSTEGSLDTESSMNQYLDMMLQYRPDLSTAYGILTLRDGFTIFKVDAFGHQQLEKSTWDFTADLQQFVAGIYRASDKRDSSLCFIPQGIGLWRLKTEENSFYMFPFHTRHSPGRRTWMAAGYRSEDDISRVPRSHPFIFKIGWVDPNQNQVEGELYDLAHRDGWIPGVARPLLWSRPGIQIHRRSRSGETSLLEQHCTVLASSGRSLSQCSSVLDILKVAYDLVEVHQTLAEQGVLHRDISFENVLCSPSQNDIALEISGRPEISTGRPFIRTLLGQSCTSPMALLIDLDSAADMSRRKPDDRTERIGTPGFISREIAIANRFYPPVPPSHLPLSQILHEAIYDRLMSPLEAATKLAVDSVHDAGRVVKYVSSTVVERAQEHSKAVRKHFDWMLSGDKDLVEPELPGDEHPYVDTSVIIPHQPHHDAESIFWLLWFLLASANPSSPATNATEIELVAYKELIFAMFGQKFGFRYAEDSRNEVLFTRGVFHNFFKSSVVVWQRYDASPYYAHVMMKGLLLVEILRLSDSDGIPLDTSEPRPMFDPSPEPETSTPMESLSSRASSCNSDSASCDSDSSAQDPEPELERDSGPPRKRRRLGESTRTCRTFRICFESPAEFAELLSSKQDEADEELKPWLEMCLEASRLLRWERCTTDVWCGIESG